MKGMVAKNIRRTHRNSGVSSEAVYSACNAYRYRLTRIWQRGGKKLLFVMLNPSTATEAQNDPTVERCERRARGLGYGAFRVVNLFAWRDTSPMALRIAKEPVGPANNQVIRRSIDWADTIVAAWGTHGEHLQRGEEVITLLRKRRRPVHHLGLTKAGHPRHPLYVAYSRPLELWFGS